MAARNTASSRISPFCLALVLIVALSNFTDGRYLPTRADESEVAALKELIVKILDEAHQHERDRHQLLAPRSARLLSSQYIWPKQLARQHYSMSNRLSDEEQANRMLFDTAFPQRRSEELAPQMGPAGLDDGDGAANPSSLAASGHSEPLKLGDKANR